MEIISISEKVEPGCCPVMPVFRNPGGGGHCEDDRLHHSPHPCLLEGVVGTGGGEEGLHRLIRVWIV